MKKYLFVLAMIAALALALSGCEVTISGNNPNGPVGVTSPSSGPSGTAHFGRQTKTSGAVAHGGLPNSAFTPEALLPNVTLPGICTYGYTRTVRNVHVSDNDQVYDEYGIFL